MSKRAEEAALKAYPPTRSAGKRYAKRLQGESVDTHQPMRTLFKKSYEQAEKDTIERAIAWLKSNAVNYIYNCTDSYPDAPFRVAIGGKCWEDLKKAMEEE